MVSMATRYMILKTVDRPTKSIVSRVLLLLEHKTWYQIKAKTQTFLPMVRILMKTLKNEVKIIKTPYINRFQPKIIKPPLLQVFISSVVQFDNSFHPVVLYIYVKIISFAYSLCS